MVEIRIYRKSRHPIRLAISCFKASLPIERWEEMRVDIDLPLVSHLESVRTSLEMNILFVVWKWEASSTTTVYIAGRYS
jgi:hypothetical protein